MSKKVAKQESGKVGGGGRAVFAFPGFQRAALAERADVSVGCWRETRNGMRHAMAAGELQRNARRRLLEAMT